MPMEIKLTGDAKDFNRVVDEAARKFDTLQQKASVGIGGKVTGGGNGGATATRGVGGAVVDEKYGRSGVYSKYIGEQRILGQMQQGTLEYADQEHRVRVAEAAVNRATKLKNGLSAPEGSRMERMAAAKRDTAEGYGRVGIYSRLAGEQRLLSQMQEGSLEYADQEQRVKSAQAAVDRANKAPAAPPTMMDKINRALYSTRIDASGNFMPLIGQLGSIVGPYGLAGAAAIGLGSAVYNRGLSSATELAQASYIGGGTAAESGAVAGIGAFLGRSAGQAQNAALGLADALHRGTYGAGVLRGLGIIDRGGIQVDKDTNYIAAVKAVTSPAMSRSQAIRVARDTGLTDELFLRDLDPADRDNFLADRERQLTPEARREAAYARLRATEIGGFLDNASRDIISHPIGAIAGGAVSGFGAVAGTAALGAFIGGPVGAAIGGGIGLTTAALGGGAIGAWAGANLDKGIGAGLNALPGLGLGLVKGVFGLIDDLAGVKHQWDMNGPAAPQQAPPSYDNSGDDPRFTPGYSGGGDIARQSIPAAWKYQQFDDALNGSANRLGGYAI